MSCHCLWKKLLFSLCPLDVAISYMFRKQTVYIGQNKCVNYSETTARLCPVYRFTFSDSKMYFGTLIHPKCLSKKRKADRECRQFQEKWSSSYLFTEVSGKAVFVCLLHVSVLKEYNLSCHYESLHANKLSNFQRQQRKENVNELMAVLKKQ